MGVLLNKSATCLEGVLMWNLDNTDYFLTHVPSTESRIRLLVCWTSVRGPGVFDGRFKGRCSLCGVRDAQGALGRLS